MEPELIDLINDWGFGWQSSPQLPYKKERKKEIKNSWVK